ncbi:hypothetical protein Vadar_003633 [Vaccinium darrowii]|uniref:Uncharacterized protein n=1 Tax=Vaccinium darrowii TaxID=229202 RepID=A0ACB7Y4Q3_9ERIC|nr:hypothetical protein Vadar_003633 [Vaccinium darrowii]
MDYGCGPCEIRQPYMGMGTRGPSPLVPLAIVGLLSYFILGPFIQTLVDTFSPLLELGGDLEDREWTFVLLLGLVLVLLVLQMTVNIKRDSMGYDGERIGLGTLLLVVVFFILYNLLS